MHRTTDRQRRAGVSRCEYCGERRCRWQNHAEARAEARLVEQGRHPDLAMWREPDHREG